jgi:MFS family permease
VSPPAVPGSAEAPVSRGYSNYVLAVLFLVYVFNFIDRQVLSILIEPIKAEFGVSDGQMGLLVGLAFALFYTFAGIPIARWADTGSRRNVIIFSVTLWSLMTAAQGLARNFLQLAIARIGLGVGEAGGTPPSQALISDYFPQEQRATALALYGNGVYLGSGLGFLLGGLLQEMFDDWRLPFLVVGVAGLPLALLVRFTVRELPRGASERVVPAEEVSIGFWGVFEFLFRRRSFLWLVIGACFQSMLGYAVLGWGPVFMGRVHDLGAGQIGTTLGLSVIVAGCGGVTFGGWLADRLGRRDAGWYMRMPAITSFLAFPLSLGFLLAGDVTLSVAFFVPFYFVANMYVGPLWAQAQNLARPNMRATASAILLFILNIAGLGIGPSLVGFLNDAFAPTYGAESVRYSLLIIAVMGSFATFFFWLGSRSLAADLANRDIDLETT